MDSKRLKDFLDKIAALESSSGKNTNHRTIASGIHEGDAAMGKYGLMPNTVNLLDKSLSKLPNLAKKKKLEANPELEEKLASKLAEKVLANQGGDEQKAAYAWLEGHNLSAEDIIKRNYKDSDRVKKFNALPPAELAEPATELEDKIANPEFPMPSPVLPKDILESKGNG